MSKFEKRLVIFALVFVVIYLGAAIVTINTRLNIEDRIERLESTMITPTEGRLLMAELFLPMLIFFTLTVCFIVVRRQRAKKCCNWMNLMKNLNFLRIFRRMKIDGGLIINVPGFDPSFIVIPVR